MEKPPAKRLRLSPERTIDHPDASNSEIIHTADPVTPTRRRSSYASPTKSSLARSHPNILRLSPTKRSSEPRGRLLRQELLGSRREGGSVNINDTNVQSSIATAPAPSNQAVAPTEDERSLNDTNPLRIDLQAVVAAATDKPQPNPRPPLSSRQPRHWPKVESRYLEDADTLSHPIIPKLVERPSTGSVSASTPQEGELELPPTPVQLGLISAPDRPRGLISSSSGGSGSGSGHNRRRVRNFDNMTTSSPLKPRQTRDTLPSTTTDITDADEEVAQEAQESDVEQDLETKTRESDAAVEQKRAELSELQSQLARCKEDLTKLESLAEALEKSATIDFDPETIPLLLDSSSTSRSHNVPQATPSPSAAHLRLFAPANLQLTHSTITTRINKRPKLIQKMTITASPPWQADMFQLSFDVFVDAEAAKIDSILQSRPGQFFRHTALQRWIEQRLDSPVHRLDVSGLIWGAGQYFEESVKRARVFKKLQQTYSGAGEKSTHIKASKDGDRITATEATALSRYIDTNSLTLPSLSSASSLMSSSSFPQPALQHPNPPIKQIHLIYDLIPSWTGTISVHVDVSVGGVGPGAEKSAKELFRALLGRDRDVAGAFERVWGVLGMETTT